MSSCREIMVAEAQAGVSVLEEPAASGRAVCRQSGDITAIFPPFPICFLAFSSPSRAPTHRLLLG